MFLFVVQLLFVIVYDMRACVLVFVWWLCVNVKFVHLSGLIAFMPLMGKNGSANIKPLVRSSVYAYLIALATIAFGAFSVKM